MTDLASELGATYIEEEVLNLENNEENEFFPLTWDQMPTISLRDTLRNLQTKNISILNLDALLQCDKYRDMYLYIWQSILMHVNIRSDIKICTLSIRFNKFDDIMKDLFIAWLDMNDTVETVYLMGSGFDSVSYVRKLQISWKKHLYLHRYENNGLTLHRSRFKAPQEQSAM